METKRPSEDIIVGYENFLLQKDRQYSQELSEVRTHLEERVREVKTDLEKDIREVKTDLKDDIKNLKEDLKSDIQTVRSDIQTVREDFKDRLSGLRTFIGIAVAIAAIIIPLAVKALSLIGD